MKNIISVRSAGVLAVMLVMSMLFVPAVSAQDALGDSAGYFSNIQPSEEGNEVHFTNLPPARKYDLVTVNPSLFAADADSGEPVVVSILGEEYLLDLEPVPAPIAEDAKCIVVNKSGTFTTDCPRIQCYKGTVVGDSESYAFFTVDDKVILGTIRYCNNSYAIDQVGTVEVDGKQKVVHAIYDSNSVIDVKSPLAYDLHVPVPLGEVRDTEQSGKMLQSQDLQYGAKSVTTVTLCTAHDWQFRNAFPSPNSEMADTIAQVNTALSPSDIGVTLQINAFCDIGTTLSATDPRDLLDDFAANIRPQRDSSYGDIAVLFTGKELDGDAIGITYDFPGSSGHAYVVVQMVNAGSTYQATFSQRCINTAHELGHVFGAQHQDSATSPSYARAFQWTEWFIYDRYTAVWSTFMGEDMRLEYSCDTRHGDASHDNARRIYEMKGTVAGYR